MEQTVGKLEIEDFRGVSIGWDEDLGNERSVKLLALEGSKLKLLNIMDPHSIKPYGIAAQGAS